ncbi:MAG: porin [Planctomycetia bacterium]|nr:porin [Planctomycetia bacterium]
MSPNGQESPSDRPAAGGPGCACQHEADGCPQDGCCEDACCGGCDDCCGGWLSDFFPCCRCPDEEPWKLFDCCELECRDITVAGWVDMGYSYNSRKPVNPAAGLGNLPTNFNYRHDEFMFNQVYLYAEKTTETDCCNEWDIGGRVDLLYGEDWFWISVPGKEREPDGTERWNADTGHNGIGGRSRNGIAMPQIYAQVAYGDWKVKLGHFYTFVAYETFTPNTNFFYSHAFTHQYSEPFSHGGIHIERVFSEQLSAHLCFINGWDKLDALSDRVTIMPGFNWKSEDGNINYFFSLTTGDEDGSLGFFFGNRTYFTNVLILKLTEEVEYVFHNDYGIWDNAGPAGTDAEWYAFTNYLYYTINDCWRAGIRYEWMNDQTGTRIEQLYRGVPRGAEFQEITIGLNWTPNANLRVRPEVRWDWVDYHAGAPAGTPIFDNGTVASQTIFGIDAIYSF